MPDPSKAKEHCELFLNDKAKQIHKYQKLWKMPKNSDLKSISKPLKKSIFITQELETVEKSNILDIESVTIEHPKTVTKLSKPKIITQQPNKIKIFTKSEATDLTLQLDIIKRHILPKNVQNVMKLKS